MSIFDRDHPSDEELFEYAEQLEAGRVPFGSAVATHALDCPLCSQEVDRIRDSIGLTRAAGALEPTDAMQASVLLAMKTYRHQERRRAWVRGMRTSVFAAVFALALGAGLRTSSPSAPLPSPVDDGRPHRASAVVPVEVLQAETPEEEVLEPALMSSSWQPENRWERAQREALEVLDDDIDEALSALQHNPALVRAGVVISSNRELKRHRLKALYAQRNL